jgi:integrase
MADIHSLLLVAQKERQLRPGTIYTYAGALKRIGIIDDSLDAEEIESRLLALDNINARRTAAIAVRAVLGLKVRVPKGNPARYDLPSEDTLRLALMLSKHETRGLLAMYGGLRLGEVSAVTRGQLDGDRLRVDRQVIELHASPDYPRICRLGPPKGSEGEVIIPRWLIPLVDELRETVVPSAVADNITRAGRRVGVKLNVHMLRHFYATESLARGMSISTVSKQLRHSSVSITWNTYAQSRDEDIHKAWG